MLIRTGIDLVEIDEFESANRAGGDLFLENTFTPDELRDCGGRSDRLAGRFAAKEAVSKALGQPLGLLGALSIGIESDRIGRPSVVLRGVAREEAERLGLLDWEMSLTHSTESAIAVVVASGPGRDYGTAEET